MRVLYHPETVVAVAARILASTSGDSQDTASFTGSWENALGIVIAFVMAGLSNSVGIGGGLFWVPLFNALLGFSVRAAAAMSQTLVACGTVGATAYSVLLRHADDPSRPLIDYTLATVLMPALVMGVSIGVLLNIIVPPLVLSVILFILLMVVACRTAWQGARQLRRERAARAAAGAPRPTDGGLRRSRSSFREWAGVLHAPLVSWSHVTELLVLGAVFLGFQIGKAQYDRCTWQYGLLFGVQVAVMVAGSVASVLLRARPAAPAPPADSDSDKLGSGKGGEEGSPRAAEPEKAAAEAMEAPALAPAASGANGTPEKPAKGGSDGEEGASPAADDSRSWSRRKLLLLWGVVLVVGVLAGMVGLGGGVLIAPIMIELGAHPQTAAATSTLIVLFSSTIASVTFGMYGKINLSYLAVYGPVCLAGGLVGCFVLSRLVRRWRMGSLITLMLAGLTFLSAGLVAGFAGRHAVEDLVNGGSLEGGDFCSV